MMDRAAKDAWAARFKQELAGNILPFWMRHTVDRENGGFYGAVDCDLNVDKQAPRAAVINARILWTYSAAARVLGDPAYREMADWAYSYIVHKFWDHPYDGLYWMLDYYGNPISDRKQIYAQAFGAYGMSEYFRLTGKTESFVLARQFLSLIEEKSYDPAYGGYLEACNREWGALQGWRILLTCSEAIQEAAAGMVHDLGGIPLCRPLIRLTPTPEAREHVRRIADYEWAVLTSPSAP